MPIDKEKIAKLLNERGAIKPCHRCDHSNFFVIDSYSYFNLQDNMSQGLVLGGPSVPFTMVACENCGAITPHALGALGLLDNPVKN